MKILSVLALISCGFALQCYVCRNACTDPRGFLEECREDNTSATANVTCFQYHLDPDKVKEYEESPDRSDINPEEYKKFKLPKEYRSCGYFQNNTIVGFNSANQKEPLCPNYNLRPENHKYRCIHCNGSKISNGCNTAFSILDSNATATEQFSRARSNALLLLSASSIRFISIA